MRMSPRADRVARALWALTLLTLPVTSFRYYPALFGSGTSKPLAFVPAAAYGVWVLATQRAAVFPRLRRALPSALPVWLLVALLSTAWALTAPPPPLAGYTLLARALRAWVSWAVGLAFLLVAVLAHRTRADVDFSVRVLFVGFGVAGVWATLQLTALLFDVPPQAAMQQAQAWFSLRPWNQARVQGLAYEPSWFADQLVVLYGAWLAAGWLSGYTRPWKRRAVLAGLTLWAAALLVWTYSRSGALVAAAAAVGVGVPVLLRAWRRERARAWGRGLALAGMALALLGGLFVAAAQRSDYFRVLFRLQPGQSLVDYVVQARAGARLAYATAAWAVFEEHPWLGVGLGGSGFYLYDRLPEWARTELRDVAYALSPEHRPVLNPKSLYPRLLAETGVVGLVAFGAFGLAVAARALRLAAAPTRRERFVGLAGLWLLVAMSVRWTTQDALSLPTFWLVAGMVLGHEAAAPAPAEPVPPDPTA